MSLPYIEVILKVDDQIKTYQLENQSDEFIVKKTMLPLGYRVQVLVNPQAKCTVEAAFMKVDLKVSSSSRLFFNGYQSWTDSQELSVDDRQPALSRFVEPIVSKYQFDKYGDTVVRRFKSTKGLFHGFSYAYLKNQDEVMFMGSGDEKSGFTIFEYNHQLKQWKIEKDNVGLVINQPTIMLDVVFLTGSMNDVFDGYFDELKVLKPKVGLTTGWTSWYHYFKISQKKSF